VVGFSKYTDVFHWTEKAVRRIQSKQPQGEHCIMAQEIDIVIGQRVRALRQVRGLSQTDLGAKIGVQFQQVQKYETGMNRISCSRIQLIADVLGVPASDFFINLGTNKDDEHSQTSKGLRNLAYDKKITNVMLALDKLGARQKASFLALLFEVAKDPK